MYSVKHKKLKHRKIILGTAVLAAVTLITLGIYLVVNNRSNPTLTTQDGSTVELKPASKTEKDQAEDNKSNIVKNDSLIKENESTSGLKTAEITITSANATTVNAYVKGIFEEGGTCTATAVNGATTYKQTSTGFANVSYTQCAPIDWPTSLGPGKWTITVRYVSNTATATTTKEVTIN